MAGKIKDVSGVTPRKLMRGTSERTSPCASYESWFYLSSAAIGLGHGPQVYKGLGSAPCAYATKEEQTR